MTGAEHTAPRRRGLMLLAAMFIAGALAGAAADRLYVVRHDNASPLTDEQRIKERRAAERRSTRENANEIEIPFALARLDLTPEQEEQIRRIVVRLRPASDSLWSALRPRARALESQLFQESLCVLTPRQLDQWKDYQRHSDFPPDVTAERLRLVTTKTCPKEAGREH